MVIVLECDVGIEIVPPDTIKSPIPNEPDDNDGNDIVPLDNSIAPLEKPPDERFGHVIVPEFVD